MPGVIRCARAEFQKLRHTAILRVHVGIPLAGALVFLLYYATASWDPAAEVSGFLEVVSMLLPLAAGIVCGMAADQEDGAGRFQSVLAYPASRMIPWVGKIVTLVLLAVAALGIAVGVFGAVFRVAPLPLYVAAFGGLAGGSVVLYVLHLVVGFRFGRGASIGLGIVETLTAALALTGLGDGIWYFLPCAWPGRLCDMLVMEWIYPDAAQAALPSQIGLFCSVCLPLAGVLLIAASVWIVRWDGARAHE